MRATLDDSSFGPPDENAGLFVRALTTDSEAAAKLYSRCVPSLQHWLQSRLPGCEAEDIAHEALLTALRRGSRFHQGARFMPWLRTIAWHLAQKRLRGDSRRKRRERDYVEHELRVSGSTPDIPPKRLAALNACLANLPEQQRQLLYLRYIEGNSSNDIAAKFGRSRVGVAVSLHRICKNLKTGILRNTRLTHPSASDARPAASRSIV
jgi:RNA polymerase sigma-70 factor, ECF subfamily